MGFHGLTKAMRDTKRTHQSLETDNKEERERNSNYFSPFDKLNIVFYKERQENVQLPRKKILWDFHGLSYIIFKKSGLNFHGSLVISWLQKR